MWDVGIDPVRGAALHQSYETRAWGRGVGRRDQRRPGKGRCSSSLIRDLSLGKGVWDVGIRGDPVRDTALHH